MIDLKAKTSSQLAQTYVFDILNGIIKYNGGIVQRIVSDFITDRITEQQANEMLIAFCFVNPIEQYLNPKKLDEINNYKGDKMRGTNFIHMLLELTSKNVISIDYLMLNLCVAQNRKLITHQMIIDTFTQLKVNKLLDVYLNFYKTYSTIDITK